MDVFSLLHEDHENVSLIFKKIESMRSKETEQTREQLFKELYTELTLHAEVRKTLSIPSSRRSRRPPRSWRNHCTSTRKSKPFFPN